MVIFCMTYIQPRSSTALQSSGLTPNSINVPIFIAFYLKTKRFKKFILQFYRASSYYTQNTTYMYKNIFRQKSAINTINKQRL